MNWVCGHEVCPTHRSPEHQCTGWRLAPIGASVGVGGRNRPADVAVIQGALNRVWRREPRRSQLKTDGIYSHALGETIRMFQRFGAGSRAPDGRVDPRHRTFRVLAGKLKKKRIVVSLQAQELYALQDGRCIMKYDCVTGDEDHPTDPGVFSIFRKEEKHTSQKYGAPMDYAMFFTADGKAIHQYHGPTGHGLVSLRAVHLARTNVSSWFGSHGCVRLEEAHAARLFGWTPFGTDVHVF